MGDIVTGLTEAQIRFIQAQRMYFVGTATADSRVNVSPKGMDSFRVLSASRVAWLNLTGSGNETAAHVQQAPRMTVMFCAFEGPPLILRIYGRARAVHRGDAAWGDLSVLFPPLPGARQIFDLAVEGVQSSCGMAVPRYTYVADRNEQIEWALRKGEEGVRRYWQDKNQVSIDGIPTHIIEHSD
jgi:hypothetical protein